MPTYPTYINNIKKYKKCSKCKKRKGKILVSQLVDNKIETVSLCVPCFKAFYINYRLEKRCINCDYCFKCDLQKVIFTSKEIKQFKINLILT